MATTIEHLYDPLEPVYWDAADARAERDRTFQICSDCRICVQVLPVVQGPVPHDRRGRVGGGRVGAHRRRAQAGRRRVLPVQALLRRRARTRRTSSRSGRSTSRGSMLRSLSIQAKQGEVQRGARLLARTDLQGRVATALSGMVNRTNDFKPVRFLMEKTTGIARNRLLPELRQRAVLEVVHVAPRQRCAPTRRRRACRSSRRASSSTRTPRSARRRSGSASATASPATCPTVRCAAGCRGSTRVTSLGSRTRHARTWRCSSTR